MLIKTAIQLLCSLVFVFGQTLASAETDLLNLATYAEGTRVPYGENMVVVQDEKTGEKWLKAAKGTSGRMNIPVNLPSDSFEITLEIYGNYYAQGSKMFLIADEMQFTFAMDGDADTLIEGSRKTASVWQKNAKNSARFVVNGGIAKVYVNDVFVQKATVNKEKQGLTYTNLRVTNINDRYILYSLKIKGGSDVAAPGGTTTPATGDCMASYTVDGKIHIPCLSVPNAFGGTNVYDIQMQQQAGKMSFDVDMSSIKPR